MSSTAIVALPRRPRGYHQGKSPVNADMNTKDLEWSVEARRRLLRS